MKRLFGNAVMSLCALLLASAAQASTATVNYNDLWWNPNESGWGVNIAQQGTFLFLTFFIYGADSKPTWVTGELTRTGQSASGQPIFTGGIYLSDGPYYGAASFNPNDVHRNQVGTASFNPVDAVSGTLSYSIGGVNVTRSIVRQTLVNDDLSGNYFGIMRTTATCPPESPVTEESTLEGTITQSGTQFQFQYQDVAGSVGQIEVCTFSGGWTQQGLLARVDGTITCSNGLSGAAAMTEVASSPFAVSARLSANAGGCTVSGAFSALRR